VTDLWWWAEDEDRPPSINLVGVTTSAGPGGLSLRIATPAQHVLLVVTGTKGSSASPPSSFNFYEDGDLTIPVQPLAGYSLRLIGDMVTGSGTFAAYAYGYLVPTTAGEVYAREAGGVDMGINGQQIWGVQGLTEASVILAGPQGPSTFEEFFPVVGDETISSQWLFVAHTATGEAETITISPSMFAAGEAAVPAISFAGNGQASETATVTVDDAADPPPILGAWWQLVAEPVIPPVTPPEPLVVTHVFTAELAPIRGGVVTCPPVTATHHFDGDLTLASAAPEWRATLVDAAGTVVHQMPDVTIGDIVETLNDITRTTVTIPLRSPAAVSVDLADQMAALEVQVWRGPVLWLWGPITGVAIEGDTMALTVSDAPWHLTQRHVGLMGNRFGDVPPYFHDPMVNLRFEAGDISGWSILRTITVGEFVGFGPIDPTSIVVDPSRKLPSGEPAVRANPGLDPLDNLQLYQDITVHPPQNRRSLRLTLSGWWYLPSDGGYAPNNQRMGLLLAPLIVDPSLPGDYYRPADVGFTTLDETAPRDVWFYDECQVDIPPDFDRVVHVSVCFPQGVSYVAGLDLQVDDGLLYDESPSTIGAGLTIHAQQTEFGKDDVNLDWWANTIGDREVREYRFADHTNIMQAISALAREAWFDWWCTYTATSRVMNFQARRRGTHRSRARIRVLDDGPSNVATITRQRTTGATSIAVQTRTADRGNHERAATIPGALVLEDVIVADREPADYDLTAIAADRVRLTANPDTIVVDTHTGDDRFLLGLQIGDTTDIVSDQPGARATGRWRLTARTTTPTRDAARLTFNPDPT
jgi:hypothetical protein